MSMASSLEIHGNDGLVQKIRGQGPSPRGDVPDIREDVVIGPGRNRQLLVGCDSRFLHGVFPESIPFGSAGLVGVFEIYRPDPGGGDQLQSDVTGSKGRSRGRSLDEIP